MFTANPKLAAALFCLISAGIYIARSDSPVLTVPSILSKTTHQHIEPDATPHGPYWLNEDFGFYPIPIADGRNVSLLMSFKYRDKETWPLPPGQEIYCRGEKNVEWSRMELRQGLMEPPPHEHINIFTCAASGKSMTFKHVSPAGDRYLTIPLGSVRARMSDPPMVIAWTMVNGWTPLIPLWLEYQLAHGIEEIYIYNNEDDYDAKQTLTMNLASYIVAGLVIIVPWYKSWHGHLLGDWWVSQQIAAVNHALRSFDGYAEWVLFADIDEFPLLGDKEPFDLFSYPSILAAEREEDPTLACVFMRHVFGRDLSETAPTVETALGPLRGFSPKIVRQREYYNDRDRSKWFAHPPRVPLASIHEPSRWTGTRKTLDPSTSMWTLHLSDHPEREGPEVELDFSRLAPQMDDLLRARLG